MDPVLTHQMSFTPVASFPQDLHAQYMMVQTGSKMGTLLHVGVSHSTYTNHQSSRTLIGVGWFPIPNHKLNPLQLSVPWYSTIFYVSTPDWPYVRKLLLNINKALPDLVIMIQCSASTHMWWIRMMPYLYFIKMAAQLMLEIWKLQKVKWLSK